MILGDLESIKLKGLKIAYLIHYPIVLFPNENGVRKTKCIILWIIPNRDSVLSPMRITYHPYPR